MKSKGGFIIKNFKKLETPIKHGNLNQHIYEGIIKDVPTYNGKKEDFNTTWDAFGKCSNWKRSDCFIDIPEQP